MGAPAAVAHTAPGERYGARTVLMTIGIAVLAGIGLLGTAYWLVYLPFHWVYFLSFAPLILGAYLLFTRATGPDHA